MRKTKLGRWIIALSVVLVVLLAVLLVMLIAGTGHNQDVPAPEEVISGEISQEETVLEATEPEATKPETTEPEPPALEETEPEPTIPENIIIGEESTGETDNPDVEIETAYAILHYPGKWKDSVLAEETELDFGSDVKFYGTINDQEHWLFTVHFGGGEGVGVGAIQTADGYMLDITIEMSDFVPGEDWSVDATDQFNAMQEAMNYVMNKLSQIPGFEG